MINPAGLIWWEPAPDLDIQIPYRAHAIRWQRIEHPERFGVVWVPLGQCDLTDPFDRSIAKAVLLEVFTDAYPAHVTLRRRGCPIDAWHVVPIDTNHCPGVEGGVILEPHTGTVITGHVLIDHALDDPARVHAVLRWALTNAEQFTPAHAERHGWRARYGKWHKTLSTHPAFRRVR